MGRELESQADQEGVFTIVFGPEDEPPAEAVFPILSDLSEVLCRYTQRPSLIQKVISQEVATLQVMWDNERSWEVLTWLVREWTLLDVYNGDGVWEVYTH